MKAVSILYKHYYARRTKCVLYPLHVDNVLDFVCRIQDDRLGYLNLTNEYDEHLGLNLRRGGNNIASQALDWNLQNKGERRMWRTLRPRTNQKENESICWDFIQAMYSLALRHYDELSLSNRDIINSFHFKPHHHINISVNASLVFDCQ